MERSAIPARFDKRDYICPTCGGAGSIFVRHPRYGTSSCPYEGDDEECPDCIDGQVVFDRHEAHELGLVRA